MHALATGGWWSAPRGVSEAEQVPTLVCALRWREHTRLSWLVQSANVLLALEDQPRAVLRACRGRPEGHLAVVGAPRSFGGRPRAA